MLETIRHIDHSLFHVINQDMANGFFDFVCPVLREKLVWIPLYALIAFLLYRKYGLKTLWLLAFGVLTIVLSDQGSNVFKHFVHRLRPCNNPEFASQMHKLVECGVGFSFVSAHAANHFALATFISFFVNGNKKMILLLYLWAASIAFSQVYVGVHFPADVFCGALLGILIGLITGNIAKRIIAHYNLRAKN
jgi:membrane-associated phospholipid phosphatase